MVAQRDSIRLLGRLFLRGEIEAVTGLHIGAGPGRWPSAGWTTPWCGIR